MWALQWSYKYGEEFFVCQDHGGEITIKGEKSLYSGLFDKDLYHVIKGTRKMGWSRGLHKEMGEDSPCKVLFKVEVEQRKYSW